MKTHTDIVKAKNINRSAPECKNGIKQKIEIVSLIDISPVRTSKQRMEDARNLPRIDKLLGDIWMKGELHFLFSDTGLGKSIYAVSIADCLSKGMDFMLLKNECPEQRVLYYDFELSDKQFRRRYTNEYDYSDEYIFSDNFYIDSINFAELMKISNQMGFEDVLFGKIRNDIEYIQPDVMILDNLTFLSMQTTQKTEIALETMRWLTDIKKQYELSILVLAHTPKIDFATPLSINSMAGSKQLVNFADSVSAIGRSKQGKNIRYIKQVKPSRSSELVYDTDNVITCEIVKKGNFLTYEFVDFDSEYQHIRQPDVEERKEVRNENINKAKALRDMGKSMEEIAEIILGDSKLKGTISKWLKK
jgi:hypothetical protein